MSSSRDSRRPLPLKASTNTAQFYPSGATHILPPQQAPMRVAMRQALSLISAASTLFNYLSTAAGGGLSQLHGKTSLRTLHYRQRPTQHCARGSSMQFLPARSFTIACASLVIPLILNGCTGPSASWVRGAGFRDCAQCPQMTPLRTGTFVMGSSAGEADHQNSETPQHAVAVSRPFAIGRFDVTRAEYAYFVNETGYSPAAEKCDWRTPTYKGELLSQSDTDPVVCVNWEDAQAFASWLRNKTGKRYRLPSEAEWEYAARGGATAARPWGESLTRDDANYGTDPCCGPFASGRDQWMYTSPVGSFPANRFGLYDMIGNVWQWTEDCGNASYLGAPEDGSAWTAGECNLRMVRGGAWFQGPESARSASRAADQKSLRVADIGFRVARSM
jgi:formylglycine-generating enzyme required for sulfatase activity